MMTYTSYAYFATQGVSSVSHGDPPIAPFSKITIIGLEQGKSKNGEARNVKISSDGFWKLWPTRHGNCRKRVGAGRIAEYAVNDEAEVDTGRSTARETLDMLGWPSLCDSVAGFASTAMGKDLCHDLIQPSTREESQILLDETSAALEIDGILGGVLDFGALQTSIVKRGLDRVSKGVLISGEELAAIATLLQFAQTLQRGIATLLEGRKGRHDLLQPVAKLVEPMVVHQDVYKLIWSKVDEDGIVKDNASPQLRQARSQARTLELQLQELLNKLVQEKSSAEDVQDVIDVDGRLCLRVTADKANSVPGLLFRRGGTTAYLEPTQAVSLNNKLAEARDEVKSAENLVLSEIAARVEI